MKLSSIAVQFGLFAVCITLQSQKSLIPFQQIERESQPQMQRSSDLTAESSNNEGYSSSLVPVGVIAAPRTIAVTPRIADRHFILVNSLQLGAALFDVGGTQRCIAEHRCKEGNPLMPASMTGKLSLTLGMFAYSASGSYLMKKRGRRSWWMPPLSGIVAHMIGIASGLAR